MRIRARQEDFVGVERDRAARPVEQIVVITAVDFRKLAPVLPEQIAGAAVQGLNHVVRVCKKDDTVMHQRRLFLISRLHVPGPCQFQSADIAGADLLERAVAPGAVIAPPHQPVPGIRALQHLFRDRPELL
jgi:hypothetical protein